MAIRYSPNRVTAMGLKRMINYQTRIFLLIAIFTWVITFAFFAVQYTREYEYKVDLLNARLQEINTRIISDIAEGKRVDGDYVKKLTAGDSLRVSIIDVKGRVIYDSNGVNIRANHSDRNEVKEALENGNGYTIRRQSETNDCDYFYSATRADSLIVRSALPYNNDLLSKLDINSIYGYIIVVVTCVLTIFAFFASRRIGLNVKNLRDFANCAEKGDISGFSTAVFPKDELGEISGHIINLYKNLQRTAEERDRSMREAIFEESEKNRIKQQLTNNINHELKTPVHAIQACLETLVNNGDKLPETLRKDLIDKSYQNVKRLTSLLLDVSVLTRMNEAPEKILLDSVNIGELVNAVTNDMLTLYPADKYMSINVDIPDNIIVHGNLALLESVFKNLIVNSEMHSGGTEINLTCSKDDDNYVHFTFYDNGKGVPNKHLNKIFERFYRVDEGRSRASGGTGLGLSIVRNAIAFHKGNITVKNRPEGGLQFDFTIRI